MISELFSPAISIIIFTSVEGHAIHVFLVQLWLAGLEILEHRVKMLLGEVKPASGVVTQVIVDGRAPVRRAVVAIFADGESQIEAFLGLSRLSARLPHYTDGHVTRAVMMSFNKEKLKVRREAHLVECYLQFSVA